MLPPGKLPRRAFQSGEQEERVRGPDDDREKDIVKYRKERDGEACEFGGWDGRAGRKLGNRRGRTPALLEDRGREHVDSALAPFHGKLQIFLPIITNDSFLFMGRLRDTFLIVEIFIFHTIAKIIN